VIMMFNNMKLIPLICGCKFLVTLILIFSSNLVFADNIELATGINTDPPFVYGDFDISSEYPGITIDVLNLIEKKTNFKFNIGKRPWARVVRDVKTNVLDGGFHFSFKEERLSFVAYPILKGEHTPDPSYSISDRSYILYRLKDESIRWNGERIISDSNKPVIIGAIRGSSVTGTINQLGYTLLEANTDKQLLKLLLFKRVDAIVGLENMLDAKVETLALEEQIIIKKTYPPIETKPYYIAFSKAFYNKQPEAAWKIWDTIKLIKSSGEMTEIFKRYVDR